MESKVTDFDSGGQVIDSGDEASLSWKEKYELSEQKLQRFHRQAGKVRELLAVKMKDYESRVISAEIKRDEALEKLEKLEMACRDKDEAISALTEKITRLREERNNFVAQDEDKMAKIKEWVKTNITEILRELNDVKKERDRLRVQCDKAMARQISETNVSHDSPLYEEIFGELLNDLRKDRLTYQSVDTLEDPKYTVPSKVSPTDTLPTKVSPPDIPPRGKSFSNNQSSPPLKHRPKVPPKKSGLAMSPTREVFNLPLQKEYGSLTSINDEVSKLADGEGEYKQIDRSEIEPASPVYFMLQGAVNGMEFEKDSLAPVYSTLQGVASLIRNKPFTGDTSDSEGVEQDGALEQLTANKLPVKSVALPRTLSTSTDDSEFGPLKSCAIYTSNNMRQETLEKAGWLVKLGGRVKNWKRRWFTLSEGKLNYFKTRADMYRKPIGIIDLKRVTQLAKSNRPLTFEIATPERTYYLTADNEEEVNDWLRVLRNGLRRFSGTTMVSNIGERTAFSGWVTKAKYGVSSYCWAVLKEKHLLFYESDIEQTPIGSINLREVIDVSPVLEDRNQSSMRRDDEQSCKLMIKCLKDSHPTYFVVPGRSEMELWLHQIQNMCSGSNVNSETDFEQIVNKLMNINGDAGSRYWRSKVMVHEKDPIKESLTSLSTTELEKDAVDLFKSIQLFSTTPINETAVDYHISLAQDIIKTCLGNPELQTEIYCQLIKQTSKYRSLPADGGSSFFTSSDWLGGNLQQQSGYETVDLNPVSSFVYLQCWQLLAMCTSIFLPKLRILWLLKAHLHRNGNENSDVGRYGIYCQRSLERTLQNGEREARPSRLEAISLVARNPYYRIYPLSIPVYLINGSYQIFSFDGSTTVNEFIGRINQELNIRDNVYSGFAIFTDNPIAPKMHCLQGNLKLCDVISKWEQASQQLKTGRFERSSAIKLTYRCRLFFKSLAKDMTEKEKFLHVFMIKESLHTGQLLPKASEASKMTALHAQIELGDYVDHFKQLEDVMQKLYPNYSNIETASIKRKVFKSVADLWSSLKGRSVNECVNSYISIASSVTFYGFQLFRAEEKLQHLPRENEENSQVWLAVDEDTLQILSSETMEPRIVYGWKHVVTFGGYKEDFMLVVQPDENNCEVTRRYLFAMPHGKVLELTFLIASYVNAVVKRLNSFASKKSANDTYMVSSDDVKDDDQGMRLWDLDN